MNSETLQKYLTEITPSEQRYRAGLPNTSLYKFKYNQKEILHFEFDKLVDDKDKGYFYVQKHSRFQEFPLHYHDFIEINYMYSGKCQQIINQETHTLTKGQVLLMDANTVHTIQPLGENDILINFYIAKEYLTSSFFNRFSSTSVLTTFFINAITDGIKHDNFLLFHSENRTRLQLFFVELLCEWYSPSIAFTDIIENLLSLIISELVIVYKNDYADGTNEMHSPIIIPILRYIEQNYQTCTLTQISNFFNLSPNYLSHLLKKHTSSSFKELVLEQRLKSAALFLSNSSIAVTEIANMTGCENISYFYKKFKERFGVSPGDYRKNAHSKPYRSA